MDTSFSKTITRFIICIFLALVILFLDTLHFWAFPKRGLYLIITPLEIGVYSLAQTVSSEFSFLTFWKNGYYEIEYLKQRNRELIVEAAKVKSLTEENNSLKKQFAQTPQESQVLLPARVVSFSRYLILNKGTQEGVKKGQMVISEDILVGRVLEVENHEAKITLPTDPEEKIIVVTTKNRTKGLLTGSFSEDLVLDQVLQADRIEVEEIIETAGGDGLEKGIPVAKIKTVGGKPSDIFQSARAEPLLDYAKLTDVFVKIK